MDAGAAVERRVLANPADRSYITVEPGQTAESYTAGLRQKYITALVLAGTYVLLYAFSGAGQTAMRGEAGESEAVWICSEWWDTVHYNGYLNGHLTRSMVLLVDMRDGAVLFQGEAGKDELYLTSEGTLCYFYKMGKAGRENACVCCRDIRDWEEVQTVYTFDYAEEPDIATYKDSALKARFVLGDGQVRVAWESTDRILNDNGKYEAVFSEKVSYDLSLDVPR